jgi:uncharacterized protein (TIGR02099 family)
MRAQLKKSLKILGWVAIALFGLAAAAAFGLHQWLASSPQAGAQIVAQVEQLSHFRFQYKAVDARLGWFGPEIVFSDAYVLAPGAQVPIIHARSGRVGFDAWRALSTFRLMSGRVLLEGAEVYVDVTDDGVSLRGQGDLGKDSHFSIANLPVGHLKIFNAALTVEDHRHNDDPWTVNQVGIDIERDPTKLRFGASIHLPDKIAADISLDGQASGDLSNLAELNWYLDGRFKRVTLGGWSQLVPAWVHMPTAGSGQWGFNAVGRGKTLESFNSQMDLKDVITNSGSAIHSIAGKLSFSHHGQEFEVRGSDLNVVSDHDQWRRGQFSFFLTTDTDGAVKSLKVQSPQLSLNALTELAGLLPDHPVRTVMLGLKPLGWLNQVDFDIHAANTQGLTISGGASLNKVAWQAYESIPGIDNLSAQLSVQGHHGHVSLKGRDLKIDISKLLPSPVDIVEYDAPTQLAIQPDGLSLSVANFSMRTPDGDATGLFHLWIPRDVADSPVAFLDATVSNVDARHMSNYLPLKKFPQIATHWLNSAFLKGRVPHGRVVLAGAMRQFPFRDGGGIFRATADFEDLRLHYANTFQDLDAGKGSAIFENQGFNAQLDSGHIGGLTLSQVQGGIADFKEGHLELNGEASGDTKSALNYLQSSSVGPHLGYLFMHLAGQGPMNAHVNLDFPFRQFADRVVTVDANLKSVKLRAPYWDDEIRDLNGTLNIRNFDVKGNDLTATVLGGTTRFKIATEASKKGQSGNHQLVVDAIGHATGERVATMLGFTDTKVMSGGFDWTGRMVWPRVEFRADPVLDEAVGILRNQEWHVQLLPFSVHLESSLQGLTLNLPKPLIKQMAEKRALKVDLQVDTKDPGTTAKVKDVSKIPTALAKVSLGTDAASLAWSFADGPHLDRGRVRLGALSIDSLPAQGLSVDGHAPELDLSAWLSLPVRSGQSSKLSEILRSASVDVDRLEFLSFGFPSMHLKLSTDSKNWITDLDGSAASGKVIVPFSLPDTGVVEIDLDRLAADGYIDDGVSNRDGVELESSAMRNPVALPAIRVNVKELMFQKRRFGSLAAQVERTPDGLSLKDAILKGHTFSGSASGVWSNKTGQSKVQLTYSIDSGKVEETLADWGFEPVLAGKKGRLSGDFSWNNGMTPGILSRMTGHSKVNIEQGQLINVHPGAYKVLGLLSLSALPKRLLLDFRDVAEAGLAFDTVKGDFDFQSGNATTNNLVLKGPAADIGIVGRTGLVARDYDQTVRVSGKVQTPLAAAGGVLAGPAVGAAVLLFSNVFKGSLGGINSTYYHIGGSWDNPKIDHLGSTRPKAPEATAPVPEASH